MFYVLGRAGECIKSSGCQIRSDYGHYRQLEFEESVREQREKEQRCSSRSLGYTGVADRWGIVELGVAGVILMVVPVNGPTGG